MYSSSVIQYKTVAAYSAEVVWISYHICHPGNLESTLHFRMYQSESLYLQQHYTFSKMCWSNRGCSDYWPVEKETINDSPWYFHFHYSLFCSCRWYNDKHLAIEVRWSFLPQFVLLVWETLFVSVDQFTIAIQLKLRTHYVTRNSALFDFTIAACVSYDPFNQTQSTKWFSWNTTFP